MYVLDHDRPATREAGSPSAPQPWRRGQETRPPTAWSGIDHKAHRAALQARYRRPLRFRWGPAVVDRSPRRAGRSVGSLGGVRRDRVCVAVGEPVVLRPADRVGSVRSEMSRTNTPRSQYETTARIPSALARTLCANDEPKSAAVERPGVETFGRAPRCPIICREVGSVASTIARSPGSVRPIRGTATRAGRTRSPRWKRTSSCTPANPLRTLNRRASWARPAPRRPRARRRTAACPGRATGRAAGSRRPGGRP